MPDTPIDTTASAAVVEAPGGRAAAGAETSELDTLVEADLLIEDVSIDGMCGVY